MAKADFKAGGRSAMARGRRFAHERAADPLHRPRIDCAHRAIQESPAPHGFVFQRGGYRRPPEAVFLIPESRKGDNGRSAAMSIPHRFTQRPDPSSVRCDGPGLVTTRSCRRVVTDWTNAWPAVWFGTRCTESYRKPPGVPGLPVGECI